LQKEMLQTLEESGVLDGVEELDLNHRLIT